MSASPLPRFVSLRAGPRRGLAFLCVLLLLLCLGSLAWDAIDRRSWSDVASDRGLARRHPAILETAKMIDESDAAGLVVAEALLDDRIASPAGPTVETPKEIRDIVLRGIAGRPGSAYGRLLLGRSAPATGAATLWVKPFELAVTAAPGLDLATSELAQRYIAAWRSLPTAERPKAASTIRRAFRSPAFLRASLVPALGTLGPEVTVRALPEDPVILRRAAQIFKEAGQTQASELLAARMKGPSTPAEVSRSKD